MKQLSPKLMIAAILWLFSLSAHSQNLANKTSTSDSFKKGALARKDDAESSAPLAKATVLTNCTDKINYVGNTTGYYVTMGGPSNAITGLYQSFETYEGSVIGVEFDASKSPTIAGNPVVYVQIFDLNVSPLTTSPLSSAVAVTITNTAVMSYTVMFSTPVPIFNSNGFAVGILNSNTSSRPRISLGPLMPNNFYNYSWVTDIYGGTYPDNMSNYFSTNGALDVLVRPIVTTTVNPSWMATKTSSGCALPVIYNFNNTSPYPSSYTSNTMICPGGISDEVDFGDGSTPIPFYSASHSYTNLGNYVAGFTETYVGWTGNCTGMVTANIQVDNPIPAFTYTANGLNVTFANTSAGITNFVWNFGDLKTSTQANPGTHTFDSPGTYVVELEGTAPCGTVRYTVSITITAVGIFENNSSVNQISLYPNPASTKLIISTHGDVNVDGQIEVYNSFGALVKTVQQPEFVGGKTEIDLSSLQAGMYFIKLSSEKKSFLKSFVKE